MKLVHSLKQHPTIHLLGLSSILSYGLLFYAFALLKAPLAQFAGTSEQAIMTALSIAFLIKALSAPWVGKLVDRHGALRALAIGLFLGGVGLASLTAFAAEWWIWVCFLPISLGYSMATYEVAFGAAVQYDETHSRRNISIITFYGGVASSLTWLGLGLLLPWLGLSGATLIAGLALMGLALVLHPKRNDSAAVKGSEQDHTPFSWHELKGSERRALVTLAAVGVLHELVFGATSLLFISWFILQGFGAETAVVLAAVYGPFQVIGRVLEMRFGASIDARYTGTLAITMVAIALLLLLPNQLVLTVLAMAIFGMGNGVVTVSSGYVVNMYFRAQVYGRAKGLITAPRSLGSAIAPALGIALFDQLGGNHFLLMALLCGIAALFFSTLLKLRAVQGSLLRGEV